MTLIPAQRVSATGSAKFFLLVTIGLDSVGLGIIVPVLPEHLRD